jgi:hypothetical protein
LRATIVRAGKSLRIRYDVAAVSLMSKPRCPQCGLDLDPLDASPSPKGSVHRACVEAATLLVSKPPTDESPYRLKPMYGGPRPPQSSNKRWVAFALVTLTVVVLALVLARR